MMERNPEAAAQLSVSGFEEHAWLTQQQYPEQSLRHFSAWRFAEGLDLARLEQALQAVIEQVPDLNARYCFNDDGELNKLHATDWRTCVAVSSVDAEAQAEACVQALRSEPWDAERQPPFNALVQQHGQATILAFVLHPVLDQTCREDDLYRMVMNAYAGRPVGAPHLPWRQWQATAQTASTLPQVQAAGAGDDAAQIILGEFRSALAEPGMGLDDDFFDFGGHSLLATRIIGKLLGSHGLEVQFNDFFSAPTAKALAARAQVLGQGVRPALPGQAPEVRKAPFALAQASLGRAYAAFDFGTIFNLPFAMDFLDEVDEALFEQAFADLVERHASLRSTFHFSEGEAYQQIVPLAELPRYRWFWPSHDSAGASLASEAGYRFDLSRELPMRVRFFRDPQHQRQSLSLLVHHMAIDEWSLNVMMQELAQAYQARANGRAPIWDAPAPSFHEYAQREQAKGIDAQHLAYWTDMLRPATPGLALPAVDGQAGVISGAATTRAEWFEIRPQQALIDGLHGFARQNNASLFGVLYTAIAVALHKVGGLRDLVIGTSASGRTDPAYYDTVGYFTTMVAHRVQFDAQQSVGALIEHTSRMINDSMAFADVPMEQIQQALGMTAADGLLFDVYVQIHANNALNGELPAPEAGSIRYRQIDPEKNQSMFGIQFEIMDNVIDGQRALRLVVTYRSDRYSAAQMARVRTAIEQVLAQFVSAAGADARLEQVAILAG
jgi:non-ribosomal peptide synthetase component F